MDDDVSLVPCPACGRPIYEEAERCPECGQYRVVGEGRRSGWIRWGALALVALLLAIFVFQCL